MNAMMMEIQALAMRWFIHSKRRPVVLIAGLFQPFIWLVLFSAVFKNSPMQALVGADSYMGFITPGALVFTAFTGALNGGVPILFDRELGFLDRLLAAPLRSRFSIIWATGFHIFVMTLLQCLVIVLVTGVMGVRFAGGIGGVGVFLLVLALITMLFTTFSLMLAFVLRYHFELISIIMIISLPLMFMSTAFAPIDYMPSWLVFFVSVNPITLAVEPLRAVFFQPEWQMGAVLLETPLFNLSMTGALGVLIGLNVVTALLAKGVIQKKLA
ncbi:ABC transporter permease [Acanthopleuribacter pedis]|uniref:Transport permease protein n=1 Tax=Acanthopleuribacter pedis TaxID=442870 RepID=A0A8J7QEM2_9BACT|nr:ABC transporter permease [Acanthopleuribacter pedis]MBO1322854.1 ABC transporter permease [Acanthopleuribacter pedis]